MASFDTLVASAEGRLRSSPLPSLGGAVAVGFVISRLPIFGIAVALVRLATALARPALMILGLLKARDLLRKSD